MIKFVYFSRRVVFIYNQLLTSKITKVLERMRFSFKYNDRYENFARISYTTPFIIIEIIGHDTIDGYSISCKKI